jgi:hypothetical protein
MKRHAHLFIIFAAAPTLVIVLNYPVPAISEAKPLTQTAPEQAVQLIPLDGPLSSRDAELSGMTWHNDHLIILPQYPDQYQAAGNDGQLFMLPKRDLLAFIDGQSTTPLTPIPIPFHAPGLRQKIAGYEGFESVVAVGDKIFMTIEARTPSGTLGYLVGGTISPDLSEIRLDVEKLVEIPPQAPIANMTDEAILVADENIVSLFEAYGLQVNVQPVAHVYNMTLSSLGTVPFPNIEYRITDATSMDANQRFWAINYLFPGDMAALQVATDPIAAVHGEGPTHAQFQTVERLVEFQYTPEGITLTDTPPIQLQLIDDANSRNWEGIVRLDERGFLLVTDKFPTTLLGFVAKPKAVRVFGG